MINKYKTIGFKTKRQLCYRMSRKNIKKIVALFIEMIHF
jgi:hypothetical protein